MLKASEVDLYGESTFMLVIDGVVCIEARHEATSHLVMPLRVTMTGRTDKRDRINKRAEPLPFGPLQRTYSSQ